jgi:hypothetical protein
MLPTNTLEILKNLQKEDMRRLGDFIQSPYFNSKETLYLLYKEILKQCPELKEEKFEYTRIYKKIYGGEFKEQTIKNLYSEFGGLLKKFIAHERLESSEEDFNLALIKGLTDKKSYEAANKIITSAKKSLDRLEITEEEKHLYTHIMEMKYHENSASLNMFDMDELHVGYNSVINRLIFFFLDSFYMRAMDDFIVTKAHKVKKDSTQIQKIFLETFDGEKFFNQENQNLFPAELIIHYLFYKYSQTEVTYEEYKKLEDLVFNNFDELTVSCKIYCWQSLQYILILKIIPNNKKHYEDVFRISDFFFKQKLFPNKMSPTIAKSLVRDSFGAALVLKKFDWAENFINEVWHYMDKGSREDEMNYSLGRLYFQTKRYEQSLDYLSKVKFQVIDEKINIRFYYLMNYIELKSYQSAISMLNSIRQFYFESKKLPEMYAVLTENSLKFFREIIRAEENNKKLDYSIFKEAQNAGRYYHKQYILAKMEELVK